MRVAVASVQQESNTFNPVLTELDDFKVLRGSAALENPGSTSIGLGYSQLSGIVSTLMKDGIEPVPILAADSLPGGPVSTRAYEPLKRLLLEGIGRTGKIDGVCLALHGSMYVQGVGHGESDLLTSVRRLVGKTVPLVASLDIHANVTDSMVASADALVAYRTIPHTDAFETGQRAAALLLRATTARLTMAAVKLPLLIPGEAAETDVDPMRSLVHHLDDRSDAGVISSSFATGDTGGDVYDNGVVAIAITDGGQGLALEQANRLAAAFWERRREFKFKREAYAVDEGIQIGLSAPERPVFLSDLGDDPTAGATSDTTFVLERLVAKGVKDVVLAAIFDPDAVSRCSEAGVGNQVSLQVGGKLDRESKPLNVTGKVVLVLGGRQGSPASLGRIAVLDVNGITLLLSEKRVAVTDPDQMREYGIEPLDYRLVVLKMGYLFPKFETVAPRSILLLSPGCADFSFNRTKYRHLRRPIYPLDEETSWSPLEVGH